jgi:hypothetical protein
MHKSFGGKIDDDGVDLKVINLPEFGVICRREEEGFVMSETMQCLGFEVLMMIEQCDERRKRRTRQKSPVPPPPSSEFEHGSSPIRALSLSNSSRPTFVGSNAD